MSARSNGSDAKTPRDSETTLAEFGADLPTTAPGAGVEERDTEPASPELSDATLGEFASDDTDSEGHPGDYDYEAAIERDQKPWRHRDALEFLYSTEHEGCSLREIATEHFDGAVNRETVRQALHDYDLIDGSRGLSLAQRLQHERADAELDDDRPEGDDSYQRYTLRGQ